MKNLRYLMLATLAAPAIAGSSADQQYQTLQQAYYHFDPKAYQSFTCHVDVSPLDAVVANLKQVDAAHPGLIHEDDSLTGYTLNFDHEKGVSLTDPSLDITILNEKLAADPEKLKHGIEQTKHGFDATVQGVDKILTGLFADYLETHQDISSVTRDGSKWVVKYTQDGAATTETIDGSHVHAESSAKGISLVSDSDYAPVNGGKPALHTTNLQVTQGPQSVTSNLTVTYQALGPLQVPASLVAKTTSGMVGITQTVDITINFQNCSIKN